jgi:hypothetical protein
MVDPLTIAAAGVPTAYFLKDQFDRVFGPTSDYLGNKILGVVQRRIENVNAIVEKIDQPGSIHPRMLERLINSGSYIEDDLTQQYFAGVMATSRTKDGKDDRGLYFLDLIGKLSHKDLKIHYILYSLLRKKHLGTSTSIFVVEDRHSLFNRMNIEDFFQNFNYFMMRLLIDQWY